MQPRPGFVGAGREVLGLAFLMKTINNVTHRNLRKEDSLNPLSQLTIKKQNSTDGKPYKSESHQYKVPCATTVTPSALFHTVTSIILHCYGTGGGRAAAGIPSSSFTEKKQHEHNLVVPSPIRPRNHTQNHTQNVLS